MHIGVVRKRPTSMMVGGFGNPPSFAGNRPRKIFLDVYKCEPRCIMPSAENILLIKNSEGVTQGLIEPHGAEIWDACATH